MTDSVGITTPSRGVIIDWNGGLTVKEVPGDVEAILRRIHKRLKAVGLSKSAAGLLAGKTAAGKLANGVSREYIRSIEDQAREGSQKSVRKDKLTALAIPLKTTFEWLYAGVGPEDVQQDPIVEATLMQRAPIRETTREARKRRALGTSITVRAPPILEQSAVTNTVPVVGVVQPGHWFETGSSPEITAKVPADPRFPIDYQYAFLVQGHSCNGFAISGDYLMAVDFERSNTLPKSNDIVIVLRSRSGLHEITARRLVDIAGDVELSYDSTDQRYSEPQRLAPGTKINDTRIRYEDEGIDVELRGVVVGVYRMIA